VVCQKSFFERAVARTHRWPDSARRLGLAAAWPKLQRFLTELLERGAQACFGLIGSGRIGLFQFRDVQQRHDIG
jgi:hypothetical protein